ncbi:MAG: endonuclease/exonuclease/phosphatase family protein [Deltaproteobacteria bacterium]|nr:endonuclease/exonuclease/phosphatase family protein [Deltaproteobacteria bacterium]
MVLRVMSYNVRYFGHTLRGVGSTKSGLQAIATSIAALEDLPDVVCLQEVETRSLRSSLSHDKDTTQLEAWTAVLSQALEQAGKTRRFRSYYYPAHQYALGNAKLYTTGLGVLVADDLEVLSHNADAPHDITHRKTKTFGRLKQTRICAHVRIRNRRGESLDVFNTHLSLPAFTGKEFFVEEARMGYGRNQIEELASLVGFVEKESENRPFLLMGDFNSLSGSAVYQEVLRALPVVDPFPDLTGLDPLSLRKTWPTAGFMNLRMRIDHMFLGRGLVCRDIEGTHPFGQRDGLWHGLSDHVPVLGRFTTARRTL